MKIAPPIPPTRRLNFRAVSVVITVAVGLAFTSPARAAGSETDRLARLEAAVNALQSQNAELKKEVSSLKNQKPAAKSAVAGKTPDGKGVMQTVVEKLPVYVVPGGNETKLVLGGYLQGDYNVGDVDAYRGRFPGLLTAKTKDRFRLRRARIALTGDFLEQFDFKLQGDFQFGDEGLVVRDSTGRILANNTNRTAFSGADLWVNWHALPEANIRVGQYIVGGMEILTPDIALLAIERSQVTEAIVPDRQIGLQVWGKPLTNLWPKQKDFLSYTAGVYNGNGRNTITNDNNEYMYAATLDAQLYKGKVVGQDVLLKFGGNYFTDRDDKGTNISPIGNLLVGKDGSLSAGTLPGPDERHSYGVHGSLQVGPFDVVAEYLDEKVSPREVNNRVKPGFKAFDANGYYVAAGLFVLPKKVQLIGKYETFNPGQVANDDFQTATFGINYLIKGNDLKLMADYVHTWSDFRDHNPRFGDSGFDEVRLRAQVVF